MVLINPVWLWHFQEAMGDAIEENRDPIDGRNMFSRKARNAKVKAVMSQSIIGAISRVEEIAFGTTQVSSGGDVSGHLALPSEPPPILF